MKLYELHNLIKAACPIAGINSDGAIIFSHSATPEQKAAANAIMAANLSSIGIEVWSRNPLLNKVREAREIALNRLMGIAFAAQRAGDTATIDACLVAREGLLGMTATPAVLAATSDAELSAALVAVYAGIVGVAPANIVSAFAGFNL